MDAAIAQECRPGGTRPRAVVTVTAGPGTPAAAASADPRREELLRLLGAPVARELEHRAALLGVRPVELLRAAVGEYLRRPAGRRGTAKAPAAARPRR